jgi:AcrR family transcriptional regulator
VNTKCAATDRRREGGERTRRRLLDAARALLAERGEGAVTLREITEAADANVAAVSYHFGSLGALCRATIEEALATLIDESVDRLRALGDDATLDEIAAALAKPLITALGDAGCAERSFLRIMARTAGSPPPGLDEWMQATLARADAELLAHLRRALPGVPDDDLRFRMECATGMLNSLASGRLRVALEDQSAAELERLFIPVLSGVLAAGSPALR